MRASNENNSLAKMMTDLMKLNVADIIELCNNRLSIAQQCRMHLDLDMATALSGAFTSCMRHLVPNVDMNKLLRSIIMWIVIQQADASRWFRLCT